MKITWALCCLTLLASISGMGQTWRSVYGAYGQDEAAAVRWIGDERIMVAGSTGSGGAGASDLYLMEINGSGDRQWSAAIGTLAIEQATDLVALNDGNLLIAGYTNIGGDYDGLLVKTDATGQVIWQYTYGGEDWDFFREVLEQPNGELVAVGQSFGAATGGDVWFVQMNAEGIVLAEQFFGGPGEQDGRSICATADGFALAGRSGVEDASDVLLLRIDAAGDQLWSYTYGGDSLDMAYDVVHTTDGGFSLVGITHSSSPYEEGYHLKTDGDGLQQWARNWGQINDQGSFEHVQLSNGEFVTVGYTKTSGGGGKDMFLLKSAEGGDFIFGRTYGGQEDDVALALDLHDTGFLCAGWSNSYGAGGRDVFVVRTDEDGFTATELVSTSFDPVPVSEQRMTELTVLPNPSDGTFTVRGAMHPSTWRLLDSSGREVGHGVLNRESDRIVSDRANGVYILELTMGPRVVRTPVIIAR